MRLTERLRLLEEQVAGFSGGGLPAWMTERREAMKVQLEKLDEQIAALDS